MKYIFFVFTTLYLLLFSHETTAIITDLYKETVPTTESNVAWRYIEERNSWEKTFNYVYFNYDDVGKIKVVVDEIQVLMETVSNYNILKETVEKKYYVTMSISCSSTPGRQVIEWMLGTPLGQQITCGGVERDVGIPLSTERLLAPFPDEVVRFTRKRSEADD